MAALAIMAAQLIIGGWCVSPWFTGGDVTDVVAFLVLGVSLLAGVPGSVLTVVAYLRRSSAAATAAVWWTGVHGVLLVAVTVVIVAVTDPGGEWVIDWEVIALAALEIMVSYALARDTAQRRTQVYVP